MSKRRSLRRGNTIRRRQRAQWIVFTPHDATLPSFRVCRRTGRKKVLPVLSDRQPHAALAHHLGYKPLRHTRRKGVQPHEMMWLTLNLGEEDKTFADLAKHHGLESHLRDAMLGGPIVSLRAARQLQHVKGMNG